AGKFSNKTHTAKSCPTKTHQAHYMTTNTVQGKQLTKRRSIALFNPIFAGGGAEAVALWIVCALQDKYDVTLFTVFDVDIDELNGMYATYIDPKRVQVRPRFSGRVSSFLRWLRKKRRFFGKTILHYSIRWFKAENKSYDACFCAYNAIDVGRLSMQYLHWHDVLRHRNFFWISDFSEKRAFSNISVANSQFTADCVEKLFGRTVDVLYPPVVYDESIEIVPWSKRKPFSFVCSGRIVQAKSPHRIIEILKEVRQQGYDVELHLTGGGGGDYADSYVRKVRNLVRQNSDWVTLHTNLPYRDYIDVLRNCRYGFHLKTEPFGISVAEIMQMGLIPLVRCNGGQVEIVGTDHPEILFNPREDHCAKIIAILRDEAKQQEILDTLSHLRHLFTPERFIQGTQKLVDDYFAGEVG
ncbi:MAG: glycosyltransferase family 4 protein, partial [Cyanobacteria bacterium P01_D01_bin.73]